jgi:hypothetical protein
MLLTRLRLLDKVDLVLEDEDVLELHDFNRGKVLRGLRLWAGLISSYRYKKNNISGLRWTHSASARIIQPKF